MSLTTSAEGGGEQNVFRESSKAGDFSGLVQPLAPCPFCLIKGHLLMARPNLPLQPSNPQHILALKLSETVGNLSRPFPVSVPSSNTWGRCPGMLKVLKAVMAKRTPGLGFGIGDCTLQAVRRDLCVCGLSRSF